MMQLTIIRLAFMRNTCYLFYNQKKTHNEKKFEKRISELEDFFE